MRKALADQSGTTRHGGQILDAALHAVKQRRGNRTEISYRLRGCVDLAWVRGLRCA
jgi:hypothetical protein